MPNPQSEALAEFDRIVELPEVEHAAAIAALDPVIAAAVMELLRADAANSGVLDRGVQVLATELIGTEDRFANGTLKSGDRIGAFVLQRLLGRGGMGEVWLAERRSDDAASSFVQQVALKLLKRGMDSEAISARFVQERKIMAELNHPHFARFIDGGINQDGRLYFAMEYVNGVNLLEHANAMNLSIRERVRLLAEVSEAVAYAQNHLVVHRDLKPSNILVDATGAVRVLDFGIAKLLGERAPDDTLTQTGVHALSPAYAAPEQVLGGSISTATDVYALGVILFELLTGTLPHTRNLISYEALMAQIDSEQAPAPSQALRRRASTGSTGSLHSARALREVSGDLDTIVLTALKREPARRYASAAAFADDLRRWLEARPIAAQPDSRTYRIKKFVARNRLAVGSASAVLLALIAGLSVALWQAGVAREQATRAKSATKISQQELLHAETVKTFISTRLWDARANNQDQGANLSFKDWVLRSIPRIDSELNEAPRAQIEIGTTFAQLLIELDEPEKAVGLLDKAVDRARKRPANEHGALSIALTTRGNALSDLSKFEDSQRDLQESLALLEELAPTIERRDGRIATRSTMLINAKSLGRIEEALALARANISDRSEIVGADAPELAVDYNNLATMLILFEKFDEARSAAQRTGELLNKGPEANGARLAYVHGALAAIAIGQHKIAAGKQELAQSVEISARLLGADSASTMSWYRLRFPLLLLSGEIEAAAQLIEETLPKVREQKNPFLPEFVFYAAQTRMLQNQDAAALKLIAELTEINAQSPSVKRALPFKALCLARLGARSDAEALLPEIQERYRDKSLSNNMRGDTAVYLSATQRALGKVEAAKQWWSLALQAYQHNMSADAALERARALTPLDDDWS